MNLSTPDVCGSAVELFGGPMIIIAKHIDMSPKEVCNFLFDCGNVESPLHH